MFSTTTDATVRCSHTNITGIIKLYSYPVAEIGLYYSCMFNDIRKDNIFHEDKGNGAPVKDLSSLPIRIS